MKRKRDKAKQPVQEAGKMGKIDLPGYQFYPAGEDAYHKFKEEENIDPENITQKKNVNKIDKTGKNKKKDFVEVKPGSDLDVPGSELDDPQENVGSEDEENNYYSLGGDDHNDLDEDKGE